MTTIEQLKEKHLREIAELEKKETIARLLPVEPTMICVYSDHVSATYGKTFPERYSFKEAYAIFRQFSPVESEHWKDGCLSCRPEPINKYAKSERAVLDGTSIAEIVIAAGKGYDSHALKFWAMAGDTLVHVSIEIRPEWKWLPDVKFTYNQSGDCITKHCRPASIGEDSRTMWWSPDGSYRISYYWADVPKFEAFAGEAR